MTTMRALSEAEFDAAMSKFKGTNSLRDRALLVLGVKSGFRISELLSLRWEQLCPGGQWTSRILVSKDHMKGRKKSRSVALNRLAQRHLAEYRASLDIVDDASLVFPFSRFQAWRIIKTVTGQGTHCMRKTFAHRVYSYSSFNIVLVKDALGHSRITTTQRYLSSSQSEIDRAVMDD